MQSHDLLCSHSINYSLVSLFFSIHNPDLCMLKMCCWRTCFPYLYKDPCCFILFQNRLKMKWGLYLILLESVTTKTRDILWEIETKIREGGLEKQKDVEATVTYNQENCLSAIICCLQQSSPTSKCIDFQLLLSPVSPAQVLVMGKRIKPLKW